MNPASSASCWDATDMDYLLNGKHPGAESASWWEEFWDSWWEHPTNKIQRGCVMKTSTGLTKPETLADAHPMSEWGAVPQEVELLEFQFKKAHGVPGLTIFDFVHPSGSYAHLYYYAGLSPLTLSWDRKTESKYQVYIRRINDTQFRPFPLQGDHPSITLSTGDELLRIRD